MAGSSELGVKLIPNNRAEFKKTIAASLKDIKLSISPQAIAQQKQKIEKQLKPKIEIGISNASITKNKKDLEKKLNPKIKISVDRTLLRRDINLALREKFILQFRANLTTISSAKRQIQSRLGKFEIDFKNTGIRSFERRLDTLNKKLGKISFTKTAARGFLKEANDFFRQPQNVVKIRTKYILPSRASVSAGGGFSGGSGGRSGGSGGGGAILPPAGGGGESGRVSKEQKRVNSSIKEFNTLTRTASKETFTFAERLGFTAARLAAYLIPASAFFQLTRAIRFAREAITDINRDINRLSQVFNGSAERANTVANDLLQVAAKYGQSGRELLNVSVLLAQSGEKFRSNDAILTVVEGLAQSQLAATFGDINNVLEGTIAVLNQFSLAGTDANKVLDLANTLSKNFAFEAENLFTAVKSGGAAFDAAGGSFEEFAATVAAIRDVTRLSAATIGTSLNTISLRLIRPDVVEFLEEFRGGLNIRDEAGQLKGVADILVEIANASKDLSTDEIGKLVQEVSGVRQGKVLIPLIEDIQSGPQDSKFLRALNLQELAPGSLARDAAIGADRIDVQIGRISASFEKLFATIGESPEFKNLIKDVSTLASNFANVTEQVSFLIPTLIKLGGLQLAVSAFRGIPGFASQLRNNNPGPFDPGSVRALTAGAAGPTATSGTGIRSTSRGLQAQTLSTIGRVDPRGVAASLFGRRSGFAQSLNITGTGDQQRVTGAVLNRATNQITRVNRNLSDFRESDRDQIVARASQTSRGFFGRLDRLRIEDAARRDITREASRNTSARVDQLANRRARLLAGFSDRTRNLASDRANLAIQRQALGSGLQQARDVRQRARTQIQSLEEQRAQRQNRIRLLQSGIGGNARDRRREIRKRAPLIAGEQKAIGQLDQAIAFRKQAIEAATRRTNQLTKQVASLTKEYQRTEKDSAKARLTRIRLKETEQKLVQARQDQVNAIKSATAAERRAGIAGGLSRLGRAGAETGRAALGFAGRIAPTSAALLTPIAITAVTDSISSALTKGISSFIDENTGLARDNAEEIISQNRRRRATSESVRGLGTSIALGSFIGLSAGGPLGALVGGAAGAGLAGLRALNGGAQVRANQQALTDIGFLNSFGGDTSSVERAQSIVSGLQATLGQGSRIFGGTNLGPGIIGTIARSNRTALGNLGDTAANSVLFRTITGLDRGAVRATRRQEALDQLLSDEGFQAASRANVESLPSQIRNRIQSDERFEQFFVRNQLLREGQFSSQDLDTDSRAITTLSAELQQEAFEVFGSTEAALEFLGGSTEKLKQIILETVTAQEEFTSALSNAKPNFVEFGLELNKISESLTLNIAQRRSTLDANRQITAGLLGGGASLTTSQFQSQLLLNQITTQARGIGSTQDSTGFIRRTLSSSGVGQVLSQDQIDTATDLIALQNAFRSVSEATAAQFGGTDASILASGGFTSSNADVERLLNPFEQLRGNLTTEAGRELLRNARGRFGASINQNAEALSRGNVVDLFAGGNENIAQALAQISQLVAEFKNQNLEKQQQQIELARELNQRQFSAEDAIRNIGLSRTNRLLGAGRITSGQAVSSLQSLRPGNIGDPRSIARRIGLNQTLVAENQQALLSGEFSDPQSQERLQNRINELSTLIQTDTNNLSRSLQLLNQDFNTVSQVVQTLTQQINNSISSFESQAAQDFGSLSLNNFFATGAANSFSGNFRGVDTFEQFLSDPDRLRQLISDVQNTPRAALRQQISALGSRGALSSGLGGLSGQDAARALGLARGAADEINFGRTGDINNLIKNIQEREGALLQQDKIQSEQLLVQRELLTGVNALQEIFGIETPASSLELVNTKSPPAAGTSKPGRLSDDPEIQELLERKRARIEKLQEIRDRSSAEVSSGEPQKVSIDSNANINITGFIKDAIAVPKIAQDTIVGFMAEIVNNLDAAIPEQSALIAAVNSASETVANANKGNSPETTQKTE